MSDRWRPVPGPGSGEEWFKITDKRLDTLERRIGRGVSAGAMGAALMPMQAINKATIADRLEADLVAMQAIIDTPNADLRADPAQEIKDIARAVRRLTRMALNDYDGTT